MAEATLTVPPQHVEMLRYHLVISVADAADSLSWTDDAPKARRGYLEVRAAGEALDRLGWDESECPPSTLTAERWVLLEALQRALGHRTDDVGADKRHELPQILGEINWLREALDELGAEDDVDAECKALRQGAIEAVAA